MNNCVGMFCSIFSQFGQTNGDTRKRPDQLLRYDQNDLGKKIIADDLSVSCYPLYVK